MASYEFRACLAVLREFVFELVVAPISRCRRAPVPKLLNTLSQVTPAPAKTSAYPRRGGRVALTTMGTICAAVAGEMRVGRLGNRGRQPRRRNEATIRHFLQTVKEARRRVAAERTMQEQLAANSTLKKLEAERARKQQAITKAKRNIERRRRKLVAAVREKWKPATSVELLFSVRWSLASGSGSG